MLITCNKRFDFRVRPQPIPQQWTEDQLSDTQEVERPQMEFNLIKPIADEFLSGKAMQEAQEQLHEQIRDILTKDYLEARESALKAGLEFQNRAKKEVYVGKA